MININFWFQRKYILKFSTDGAVLCNKKNGVQGTMKLIEVNSDGKAVPAAFSTLPEHMHKEICLYYYIGIFNIYDNSVEIFNIKAYRDIEKF